MNADAINQMSNIGLCVYCTYTLPSNMWTVLLPIVEQRNLVDLESTRMDQPNSSIA